MDQVEEVLAKTDIVEIIGERIHLKRAGRNFKALCPFHSEKTPSFIVSPERQIFKCFGCGIGGNAIKFLMEYEKMDFGEALRFLAKKAGITLRSYRPGPDEARKQRLYQINHLASELFHFLLTKHAVGKEALKYLSRRGIRKKTIEEFQLGYAPDRYDFLEQFVVGKKGFAGEELEASGLVFRQDADRYPASHRSEGRLVDRFRDRLMFPLLDHRGNIVGFSGRLLHPQENVGKYINTPETLLYHKSQLLFGLVQAKEAIRQSKRAIIVEGEFDMISPYQAGIKNVVAIKGSALTEDQVRLLHRFADEALLALDEDAAGEAASRRGIQAAIAQGLNVRVVRLGGRFKDPDEAVRKDADFFKKQIKKAIPVFDFYISSTLSRFDIGTAWGKKQAADQLVPILAGIDDEILRSHYIQKLARELAVAEEAVWEKVNRVIAPASLPSPEDASINQPGTAPRRQEALIDYLFSICFQYKKEKLLVEKELWPFITPPAKRRIIGYLKKYFKKNKKFVSRRFSQFLPSELMDIFNSFYLSPLPGTLMDKKELMKEIVRVKRELKLAFWRQEIVRLSKEVVLQEEAGNDREVVNLQTKIDKLLRLMHDEA